MGRLLEWSMESYSKTFVNMNKDLVFRLREFMDNEARSCHMDYGCVTLEYVYRSLGGTMTIEDIKEA